MASYGQASGAGAAAIRLHLPAWRNKVIAGCVNDLPSVDLLMLCAGSQNTSSSLVGHQAVLIG